MGDPKEDSAPSQLAGITSDGKTPTEQNPWYVLATIAGEQRSKGFDKDLELKNRVLECLGRSAPQRRGQSRN